MTASNAYITEPAAGATTFSAGEKTYIVAIGVDRDGKPIETILKITEKQGKVTSLISTSSITRATPAFFIAQNSKCCKMR